MSEVANDPNPRILLGSNNPPEEPPPTALQILQALVTEVETFQKITPTVKTAEEAEKAKAFVDRLRAAWKAADDERKTINQPSEAIVAANNTTFRAPLASAKSAGDALKAENQKYLDKLQEEIDKKRREDARIAAVAAAEAERQRLAAERLAQEGNLAAARDATAKAEVAEQTQAKAAFDSRTEPAKARIGGGAAGGRAMTSRTIWEASVTDIEAALTYYGAYPEVKQAIFDAVSKLANDDAAKFKDAEMAPKGVVFNSRRVPV